MTECQGCGAWNDTRRTLCVLCGTALAETDEWDAAAELPPLPPLPDGGLQGSMPSWLREPPPLLPPPARVPSPPVTAAASEFVTSQPALAPLASLTDPRTFLTEDDFPQWLRDLAARRLAASADPPSAAIAPTGSVAVLTAPAAPARPDLVPTTALVATPTPAPEHRPAAAIVAARAREERRGRDPWETLLLVLLCIGIVVAALWALVANGVFSPGL